MLVAFPLQLCFPERAEHYDIRELRVSSDLSHDTSEVEANTLPVYTMLCAIVITLWHPFHAVRML